MVLKVLLQMKWLVSTPTPKIFGTQWILLVMVWAAEDESHQIHGFGEHFKDIQDKFNAFQLTTGCGVAGVSACSFTCHCTDARAAVLCIQPITDIFSTATDW
jgi:hypothetical protein